MSKIDNDGIVTIGIDTTDITPEKVKELMDQAETPEEKKFLEQLRAAHRHLMKNAVDYTKINATLNDIENRRRT